MFAPWSGVLGLAGTLSGAGVGSAFGYGRRGAQIGGIAGELLGGGVQDALSAMSKGAVMRSAVAHAALQTAVTGGVMTAAGATAYGLTGSMDSALFWANMAYLPGNMIGRQLVPCFAAGTPVLTPEGEKPIEQLKPGDFVLSRDEGSVDGPVLAKLVEELFVREGDILDLTIAGQVIHTTPEHPFFVQNAGWTPAGELQPGDLLATMYGHWLPLENAQLTGRHETVYNLRVADFHTYFIGSREWGFGVWVHNQYTGFKQLNLPQKLEYMEEAGISGAQGLANRVRVRARGARFQAERAVALYQSGWLESIEHSIGNGRIDLLLRSGLQVETKAWHVWEALGSSIQQRRLDALGKQVEKYLAGGSRLRLDFKEPIFNDVEQLLLKLQDTYGNQLTWRVIQ